MSVILETSVGDITVDLFTEQRPHCCINFLKLCKIKYYNFSLFHSVQRNLGIQCGNSVIYDNDVGSSIYGMLYGEQAKYFEMELNPKIKHSKIGTLSMVNNGKNRHGSQFLITTGTDLDYLDNVHTVFGEVVEGIDVLMKINETFCDQENRPFKDIRIFHTDILDDPFDDPKELDIPVKSPVLTKKQMETDRIAVDEEIENEENKTKEEIEEILKVKQTKANAQILEMIGDLPDADVAPPDNVLFVCKLNSVTTEEDLEIIFSRFGNILSCEVIKDRKTNESLQYAFIEFEKPEDCESAYFKMDNVLIDDRRIHVDFSQSVAKIKWKGKGKGVHEQDEEVPKYKIKEQVRRDNYSFVFDSETDKKQKTSIKNKISGKIEPHLSVSDTRRKYVGLSDSHHSHSQKRKKDKHSEKHKKHSHHHRHSRSRSPRDDKYYQRRHQKR